MTFSRRVFNQQAFKFLLGATVPPVLLNQCQGSAANQQVLEQQLTQVLEKIEPEIELLVPTFLGNDQRRFYGRGIPKGLKVLDRFQLGSGRTFLGTWKVWSGAGWTGQPTITKDRGKLYLVIGAYDHNLRKIDLATNEEVWRYRFDDILKGSSTLYIDETASAENRIVILQGSRSGGGRKGGIVPSFRAISFRTGKELWKLNIRKTASYSRDNDSSALYLGNGLIFNMGENAVGYFLESSTKTAQRKQGIKQPKILSEIQLYENSDIRKHGGNLVAESSPSRLGNQLFVAVGAGHIYGISVDERKIIWDFYTGSDLDGSVVISKAGKLFCAIEKQYIPGNGGVLKLNPKLESKESIEWFLPTGNQRVSGWEGGIIGSVALNDEYNEGEEFPAIFATNAIDGNLYIGSQEMIADKTVSVPWLKQVCATPKILFKQKIGASISTPIFTDGGKLITAGYNGVYLFNLNWEKANSNQPNALPNAGGEYYRLVVEEAGRFKPGVSFEATPVVWDGMVRICGRDGWMYTLG